MPANILIADDHSIVRTGVKAIIKDQINVGKIDEASSDEEIIKLVKNNIYHVLLLDINIPGADFTSLMYWLKNNAPEMNIIVFSMYTEDIYGQRCLQLGAKAFLHKSAPDAEIVDAFRKVLNGDIYISGTLKKILLETEAGKKAKNPFDSLSVRELEIARLINKGYKLPEICSILNIQYSTANTYKRRIFEKLDVPTPVALSRLMESFKISI